jgi:hypothetical protein
MGELKTLQELNQIFNQVDSMKIAYNTNTNNSQKEKRKTKLLFSNATIKSKQKNVQNSKLLQLEQNLLNSKFL